MTCCAPTIRSHCNECRMRAFALSGGPKHMDNFRASLTAPTTHVSDEEVQLLVQGRLSPDSKEAVLHHLKTAPHARAKWRTCARGRGPLSMRERIRRIKRADRWRLPQLSSERSHSRRSLAGATWLAARVDITHRHRGARSARASPGAGGVERGRRFSPGFHGRRQHL
jgi:hypothetical protein